jgi:hypothetical protein
MTVFKELEKTIYGTTKNSQSHLEQQQQQKSRRHYIAPNYKAIVINTA